MSVDITGASESFQAVFALDVVTASLALTAFVLASGPTFKRIKSRKLSVRREDEETKGTTPLKTTLGTYLFLWPALFCLFFAYTCRLVSDLLYTSGEVDYASDLELQGRPSFTGNGYTTSISVLSFCTVLANVFVTTLLTGGVWIHSAHVTNNGSGIAGPNMRSKIYNSLILLAIFASGVAAWARGVSLSNLDAATPTFSAAIDEDTPTRAVYVAHRIITILSSLSVATEVWRSYGKLKANSNKDSSDRSHLQRFAFVILPFIFLRNCFIILEIVLIWVDTGSWSLASTLAVVFLEIVFIQLFNLAILLVVLWGAWDMGKTRSLYGSV